jgi:hypothetical protein
MKTSLNLIAYKLEVGTWAFDHEHDNTVRELLCNGTERAIDSYFYFLFGRSPVEGDKIRINVTTVEPEDVDDYDTVLTFQESDENGTTYIDEVLCDYVWLCPWLQGYFGEIPDKLYIQVSSAKRKFIYGS